MSAIWMDPVEMKSTAGTLAEQAMRIQETMTGTRATCLCEVPRSLVGWLDDELLQITEDALRVAVVYLQQVLDLATRANQIQADQSLAASQATGLVGTPAGAFFGPSVMGGFSALASAPGPLATTMGGFSALSSAPGPFATTMGGFSALSSPPGPLATTMFIKPPATSPFGSFNPAGDAAKDHIDLWTKSRPGATYVGDGLYRGNNGNLGTISNVYRGKNGGYEVVG